MRILKSSLFAMLILTFFMLFACDQSPGSKSENLPNNAKSIGDRQVPQSENEQPGSDYEQLLIDENKLLIPIGEEYRVLQVLDVNLDLDLNDEQIIVLKRKDIQDSHLKVIVVDFDSIRNTYFKSWEAETNAVNAHDFSLSLSDIVGDHNLEIILQGTNEKGELTLDVFRRTTSPNGLGLFFTNICKIVSNGSIEIEELERSESYQLGQKNGISFPIVVYTHDPESKNIMDLLKMTYYWKYPKNSYILSSVEKIPGKVVEEKRLKELFNSKSTKAFENFINGPWYHAEKNKQGEIILFQPAEREINIYSGNVEESYKWIESVSKIYNRLRIVAQNEFIPSIRKTISVRVRSLYEIDVSFQGKDRWDFSSKRYIRLPEKVQREMVGLHRNDFIKLLSVPLKGIYRNDSQKIEVFFNPPYFKWTENGKTESGGFALFSFSRNSKTDIIELLFIDGNGMVKKVSSFDFDFEETREGKELKRVLTMKPVEITASKAIPLQQKEIKLWQIEFLNDQPEKK